MRALPSVRSSAVFVLALASVLSVAVAQTPLPTSFTYQGRLLDGGTPANGLYDLEFSLWDDPDAGNQIGTTQTVTGVVATDGLLSAEVDFGADAFRGDARWLHVAVQPAGGGGFTPLTPPRALTSAPTAQFALDAATADAAFTLSASDGDPAGVVVVNAEGHVIMDGGTLAVDSTNDRVGVGIPVPAVPLDVFGLARVRSELVVNSAGVANEGGQLTLADAGANVTGQGANTWNIDAFGVGPGNALRLFRQGSTVLSLDVQGRMIYGSVLAAFDALDRVGINTTSPLSALHVESSTVEAGRFASPAMDGTWLRLMNMSTGGRDWNLISSGSNNSEGAGKLLLRDGTAAAVRMTLTGSGSVGIGTTDPTSALHVESGAHELGRLVSSATGGSWLTLTNSSTGGRIWSLVSSGSGNGEGAGHLLLRDGTAAAVRMTLNSNGNVGIGTTNPSTRLHLASIVPEALTVASSSGGGTVARWVNTAGAGKTWAVNLTGSGFPGGSGHLAFDDVTALATRMTISGTNGNVGIGTVSPATPLHVSSAAADLIRLSGSHGGGTWLNLLNSSTGGRRWDLISTGAINGEGAGHLLIRDTTAGLVRMTFSGTTGYVGIGNDSPDTKLHVDGSSAGNDLTQAGYTAWIRNFDSSGSGDVLLLEVGNATVGTGNNFIQFVGGNGARGTVQGNILGTGVEYASGGSDFAEELPQLDAAETMEPGDVVGVFAGRISRRVEGAEQVMAISDTAAFRGNAYLGELAPSVPRHAVGFIGQVRVKVRGPVRAGDLVVASGRDDGTGVAVAEADLRLSDARRIVGRAWEASDEAGVKRVVVAVGLPSAQGPMGVLAARLNEQESRLRAQEERLARVEELLRSGRDVNILPASH